MKSTLCLIGTICVGLAQHALAESPATSASERPVPSISGSQLPVTTKTTAKPSTSQEVRPAATPADQAVIYTVQPRDTLSRIAAGFGCSVSDIAQINHLRDPDKIERGQRLIIVPPKRIAAKSVAGKPSEKPQPASTKPKTAQTNDREEEQKIVYRAD